MPARQTHKLNLLPRWPFRFEAGYSITSDVLVIGELGGTMTTESVPPAGPVFDPAVADSRYISGTFSLVLRGRPLDIVLGVEHLIAGKNTLAGTRFNLYAWHLR